MPDPTDLSGNQLSFSRFAFNIYGTLNQTQSLEATSSASPTPPMITRPHNAVRNSNVNKLIYNCEKEVSCISQFNYSLDGLVKNYDENPLHHLIIGGKNYLKLLAMNYEQTKIIHEIDILELSKSIYSSSRNSKLTNVSTIESQNDTIACELSTGLISVYKVQNNGKCKMIRKYTDHKRCVNSLDFINQSNNANASLPFQLISGSQDGTIKLWDLRAASNKPTITISSNAHSDPVRSCQYSPHSTTRNRITILSVYDSGALCKYDLRSPNGGYQHNINMPERKWNFHTGPALSLNIHPEKEYVITGGRDQKVCVWNYGDSINNQNKMTPEHVVNTYGPVMKIRWSAYPNNFSTASEVSNTLLLQLSESKKYDDKTTSNERENSAAIHSAANSNPLFNYDFACLFLNEDPTISIYNLSRKYIPKEVISSNSNKPFQNFIWAKNLEKSRRIWTITKTNQFTAYDLQGPLTDSNVTKPLDNLSNVSMSWCTGLADLCFVNQDKGDFESISQVDHDSFRSESEEYDMESGLPLDGSGLGSTSFMGDHPSDDRSLKYRMSSNSLDNSSIYHSKHTIASIPIASNPSTTPLSYQNPSIPNSLSPNFDQISKPLLQRASTHNPITPHQKIVSSKLQNRNNMGIEALMEYGTNSTSGNASPSGYLRPSLHRNHSQSTQGSNTFPNAPVMPYQTLPPPLKRTVSINYPSPYVIPLSIPLPQNNEEAFETLSNNYLISTNDGFSLIDICLFNANVSAAVNKFRDCQTWRVLAVSLEEDESNIFGYKDTVSLDNEKLEDDIQEKPSILDEDNRKSYNGVQPNQNIDNRSILSELDNFVGSYNSNSTLTSNYGGLQSDRDRDSTTSQREANKSQKMDTDKEIETCDYLKEGTLEKTDSKVTENDEAVDETGDTKSRDRIDPSQSNVNEDYANSKRNNSELKKYPSMPAINSNGEDNSLNCSTSSSPININLLEKYERNHTRNSQAHLNKLHSLGRYGSLKSRKQSFGPENLRRNSKNSPSYNYTNSWDLDDENSNFHSNNRQIVTSNSLSSYGISPCQSRMGSPNYFEQLHHSYNSTNLSPRPYYNSVTPGSSRKNSYISPVHGFQNKTSYRKQSPKNSSDAKNEQYVTELSDVKEQAKEQSPSDEGTRNSMIQAESKLTKAITEKYSEMNGVFRPWRTKNLLKQILDYASQQGDILLCSTLTLLFYDYLNAQNNNCITKDQGLIWLSLYIEILQRKQLFSNAMYVINMAPKDLQPELSSLVSSEVNLRFYCCWCQKLLVNEKSKRKVHNDNFGYWYCDECSTKQLNCIYCNEPCKGLNIVTSLSCGHRGHFGCLREWFVDEENIECPGGCDEPVIT